MPAQSATTSGAIKALVEAAGLGISVFRDAPPADTKSQIIKRPYCTVIEDISLTPEAQEDGGAAQGGETYVTELAQLDLWMDWRDASDKSLESRTLARGLHRKLDGATLDLAPTRVYNVTVRNRIRQVERDNNIVHVSYTLAVRRQL